MRDDLALTRLLLHGWLEPAAAPELADPLLRIAIEQRLAAVDHVLHRTEAGWAALPRGLEPEHGWAPRRPLGDELTRAVLCVLYLHLVFLPGEEGAMAAEDSLSVEELQRWGDDRGLTARDVEAAAAALTAAGFARRADRRYQPGPALLAMADRAFHDELADALMRERMRRGA